MTRVDDQAFDVLAKWEGVGDGMARARRRLRQMNEDAISEKGRQERFGRWEALGLDQVKADLAAGGDRLVGGPPQVRQLAWEWVGMKEKALASKPTGRGVLSTAVPDFLAPPTSNVLASVEPSSVSPSAAAEASDHAASTALVTEKPAELLTLKPTLWGISIDLKEAARRARKWWRKR